MKNEKYLRYKKSPFTDDNGIRIYEGSIIDVDGYKSDLNKHIYHVVVYNKGVFGSDIYSDFDELSKYNSIVVIGHVENLCDVYRSDKWKGNLGQAIKCDENIDISNYKENFKNSFYAKFNTNIEHILYLSTAIGEESGEILGQIKKVCRDEDGIFSDDRLDNIKEEIGDLLYYLVNLSDILGFDIDDTIKSELHKLKRKGYNLK